MLNFVLACVVTLRFAVGFWRLSIHPSPHIRDSMSPVAPINEADAYETWLAELEKKRQQGRAASDGKLSLEAEEAAQARGARAAAELAKARGGTAITKTAAQREADQRYAEAASARRAVMAGTDTQNHEVWLAAFGGDLAKLESLLGLARFDLDACDQMGSAPAFAAASSDQHECLQLLLAEGVALDVRNAARRTPLHGACAVGSARCVRMLLEAGARVDSRDAFGATPLVLAAQGGHADCVAALIERGCNRRFAATEPKGTAYEVAREQHRRSDGKDEETARRYRVCIKLLVDYSGGARGGAL